ncbi:FixH family protein [Phenylobacterium sp.]|uniref:FixH family protein n=1 Tax=Phenylobacterium sp. TaxID=1871053 RepID=UPI00351F453A
MSSDNRASALRALRSRPFGVAVALSMAMIGPPAFAAPADYTWEAVDPFPARQVGVVLRVRLRDASGRPQAGATILATRFDKSPDGQPAAYAPVTVVPTNEYGVYAFKTDINTGGRYALTISAQLPYERQPVTGSVVFTSPPPQPARAPGQPLVRRPRGAVRD